MTATVIPFPDPNVLADLVRNLPKGARARRHLLKLMRDQRHEQMRREMDSRREAEELDRALDEAVADWLLTGGLAL